MDGGKVKLRVTKISLPLFFLLLLSGCLLFSSGQFEKDLGEGCVLKTDYRTCGIESYLTKGPYCPILSELGYRRGYAYWEKSFIECTNKSTGVLSGKLEPLTPINNEDKALLAVKRMYTLSGYEEPDYIFKDNLFDNVCLKQCRTHNNLTGNFEPIVNLTDHTRIEKIDNSYLVNIVACGLKTGTISTPFLGLRHIKYNVAIDGNITELSDEQIAYCTTMFND